MTIRQTRREYTNKIGRAPKVTGAVFMDRVRRLMKRRMIADGVAKAIPTEVEWQWGNAAGTIGGTVSANTMSEARALIKKQFGPIPPGYILIERVNAHST